MMDALFPAAALLLQQPALSCQTGMVSWALDSRSQQRKPVGLFCPCVLSCMHMFQCFSARNVCARELCKMRGCMWLVAWVYSLGGPSTCDLKLCCAPRTPCADTVYAWLAHVGLSYMPYAALQPGLGFDMAWVGFWVAVGVNPNPGTP
jgi:hypothetical protein